MKLPLPYAERIEVSHSREAELWNDTNVNKESMMVRTETA